MAAAAELESSLSIDPQHPWLGLASYSEETRAYFHGREDEAAELARRVQRKLLTVLFGQSGLGKTSLLRAGLVPKLRGEAYCPVYVRIDYAPESPPPAEQIKQAIFRATTAAGHWSRPGAAIEGESLWEFLHHRGDLLRDAQGRTLLPLLIFDQFEEIFTLGQSDDAGRLRARQFLEDLADLVENRPPAALERRLEEDEADAEHFDFARADYRILIALREDYLAHLESLKGIMPSITQNRMRLARMTGAQALSAVLKPGGELVSAEVAEAIVRFVAGGSELLNAEVEPSLLSLVCRELNTVRIAQGSPEISVGLLAGSRDTILTEFYERALADQPAGVRHVVEDELLTDSGHRESLAEERVLKALGAVGAGADALSALVNRRLLRIEERLDVRRVELTHDVLCSVVRASRDLRHEREARDEAQRKLLEQQAREVETRRALVRARAVAAVSALLMLVAGASAVFGWVNFNRARVADAEAQQARVLAEHARGEAERLVSFLIEDFYYELQPTGRIETMASLAHMAVVYYDGLPDALVTPGTEVNHGMALVREGAALIARGDDAGGAESLRRAQDIFEGLLGDATLGNEATLGLGLALFTRYSGSLPGARSDIELQRAAELLRPMAHAPGSSRAARLYYAEILNYLSHTQSLETGIQTCEEAREILAGLGARDLSDLSAASTYADTSDSQARHALALGRLEEAEQLSLEVYEIAEKVLAERPGDLRSMQNRALAADMLMSLADRRHDYGSAAEYAARTERAGEDLVRFNPSDLNSWWYWIRGKQRVARAQYEQGRVAESITTLQATLALEDDRRKPASLESLLPFVWMDLAFQQAQLGQRTAAAASRRETARTLGLWLGEAPEGSPRAVLRRNSPRVMGARLDQVLGEYDAALDGALAAAGELGALDLASDDVLTRRLGRNLLRGALGVATAAELRLGRYAQAERFARERLALPAEDSRDVDAEEDLAARIRVELAHALTLQGRRDEARSLLAGDLARYREEQASGAAGVRFQYDLAYALYVNALCQLDDPAGRAARAASLATAAGLLGELSAEARQLSDIRELGGWITAAGGPAYQR